MMCTPFLFWFYLFSYYSNYMNACMPSLCHLSLSGFSLEPHIDKDVPMAGAGAGAELDSGGGVHSGDGSGGGSGSGYCFAEDVYGVILRPDYCDGDGNGDGNGDSDSTSVQHAGANASATAGDSATATAAAGHLYFIKDTTTGPVPALGNALVLHTYADLIYICHVWVICWCVLYMLVLYICYIWVVCWCVMRGTIVNWKG
jgi:hypothetical protein